MLENRKWILKIYYSNFKIKMRLVIFIIGIFFIVIIYGYILMWRLNGVFVLLVKY